jgi:hypothetical protein
MNMEIKPAMDIKQLPRIIFLFGAGASIPAGMPKTDEITKRVLSCTNIGRHTDGSYYLDHNYGTSEQYLKRIRVMIGLLKEEVCRFYAKRQVDDGPPFNYEDLYYIGRQIKDYAEGAQDNPAILSFIERILPSIEPHFGGTTEETIEQWNLWDISRETVHYIRDVVRGMLRKEPEELNYLNFIGEAWDACKGIDIFTLNHDTVIERYLGKEHIPFTDGFGKDNGGVRHWDPASFESIVKQIRLFKLHGAVNWFLYRPNNGKVLDDKICINNGYSWDAEGHTPLGGHPEILIGTYNKMIDYANEVFIDLRHMFYQSLLLTHHVIICGYSFGDHGINKMLDSWINSPDNKLVIIDPKAGKFKNHMTRWVESRIVECWDELKSRGILKVISERIENIHWEEITIARGATNQEGQ